MELFTKYNGIPVSFSRFEGDKGTKFCKARKRVMGRYDICPFCKKNLMKGTVLLLLNNWRLFPNTIIHESCCDEFLSKEEAIKYLHEDYQKALEHKHWFNLD